MGDGGELVVVEKESNDSGELVVVEREIQSNVLIRSVMFKWL